MRGAKLSQRYIFAGLVLSHYLNVVPEALWLSGILF